MPMEESVLKSVKRMIGVSEDDTAFDYVILASVNAVLLDLRQIGVNGGVDSISGDNETWSDICSDNVVSVIPAYVGLRVRLMFDPPASDALVKAIREEIERVEWRIRIEVDHEQLEHDNG